MTSDLSLPIPTEAGASFHFRTSQFTGTQRPWLDLYGVRLRAVPYFGSASSRPFVDPALIHRCLPDELLFEVFTRMTPYSLGKAACVCRKWRYTIRHPVFWRSACLKAWQVSGPVENYRIIQSVYGGSWRKMWLVRPRLRTDGLYVSRNTYIRAGVAEWKVTNPVHVVCYYRYIRFYPSGRFLYKNSSQKVKEVVKFMNFRTSKADCVFSGHYTLTNDQVEAALLYPGLRRTVLRIRLRVRGTTAGANNRLDLLSLVTSGVNDSEINDPDGDMLGVVEGWEEDETHNPDVPAVSHRRGFTPFVFVPFEEFHELSPKRFPQYQWHIVNCDQDCCRFWWAMSQKSRLLAYDSDNLQVDSYVKLMQTGGNISSESSGGQDGLFRSWLMLEMH